MSDPAEPHGPQGKAIETACTKPWKAPRLIDLDDDSTSGCGSMGNKAQGYPAEVTDVENCQFHAPGLNQVPFS